MVNFNIIKYNNAEMPVRQFNYQCKPLGHVVDQNLKELGTISEHHQGANIYFASTLTITYKIFINYVKLSSEFNLSTQMETKRISFNS